MQIVNIEDSAIIPLKRLKELEDAERAVLNRECFIIKTYRHGDWSNRMYLASESEVIKILKNQVEDLESFRERDDKQLKSVITFLNNEGYKQTTDWAKWEKSFFNGKPKWWQIWK